MKHHFFRNTSFLTAGTIFRFFMVFISTIIYIRFIGIEGFAVIGIVYSLFNLLSRIDIPYFFSLLHYNVKEARFESVFNTLFNSVLISNGLLVIILFPITFILAQYVHSDSSLIVFYVLALLSFILGRANSLLVAFFRSTKKENIIQRALVWSQVLEFILSLILLLIFKIGVISIFIAVFCAQILRIGMLIHSARKLVSFRPIFSYNLFVEIYSKYGFYQHSSKILKGILFFGTLFISTFFLDKTSLGFLTIVFSLMNKIHDLYISFTLHLFTVFSDELKRKAYQIIKRTLENTTLLFLVLFNFLIALSYFLGEMFYQLLFGSQIHEFYLFFLALILGAILRSSFSPQIIHVFTSNRTMYLRILFLIVAAYSGLFLFMINRYALVGVIVSYLFVLVIIPFVFTCFSNKTIETRFGYRNLFFLASGVVLLVLTLLDMAIVSYFIFFVGLSMIYFRKDILGATKNIISL